MSEILFDRIALIGIGLIGSSIARAVRKHKLAKYISIADSSEEARKIAAMAEAYNMRVAPHNCASSLCTAATMQVAVTLPNFMTMEIYPYFSDSPKYVQIVQGAPEERIADGKLGITAEPGLGVTLDQAAIAPYLWAECKAQ